jgi:hypothetical protein
VSTSLPVSLEHWPPQRLVSRAEGRRRPRPFARPALHVHASHLLPGSAEPDRATTAECSRSKMQHAATNNTQFATCGNEQHAICNMRQRHGR